MQIGTELKAQEGQPLEHLYRRMDGIPYRLQYCPQCATMHKQLIEEEVTA